MGSLSYTLDSGHSSFYTKVQLSNDNFFRTLPITDIKIID